jgi:beta-lactamase regulating signal transducer with metallopeptidase domain
MESKLAQITDYLLVQSCQMVVLTIFIAAGAFFLRYRSAQVRYLLWLIVLAKCLIPPVYRMPLPVLPHERSSVSPLKSVLPEAAPFKAGSVVSPSATPTQFSSTQMETVAVSRAEEKPARWSARARFGLVWLVVAVARLIHDGVKASRMHLGLRRKRRPLPCKLRGRLEKLLAAHGYKRPPRFWLIDGGDQPFVWGLPRGSIYVPTDFMRKTRPEDLAGLLGHEISHVIRYDALVDVLQTIAQAIFWFHLLVRWANVKIRLERERCCDERSIARTGLTPEAYVEAIVRVLASKYKSSRPLPALAITGVGRNIQKRLEGLLRPGKRFHTRPSLAVATAVALVALAVVPARVVLTARAQTRLATMSVSEPAKPLHVAIPSNTLSARDSHSSPIASSGSSEHESRSRPTPPTGAQSGIAAIAGLGRVGVHGPSGAQGPELGSELLGQQADDPDLKLIGAIEGGEVQEASAPHSAVPDDSTTSAQGAETSVLVATVAGRNGPTSPWTGAHINDLLGEREPAVRPGYDTPAPLSPLSPSPPPEPPQSPGWPSIVEEGPQTRQFGLVEQLHPTNDAIIAQDQTIGQVSDDASGHLRATGQSFSSLSSSSALIVGNQIIRGGEAITGGGPVDRGVVWTPTAREVALTGRLPG